VHIQRSARLLQDESTDESERVEENWDARRTYDASGTLRQWRGRNGNVCRDINKANADFWKQRLGR